jgi:hypothetical protein
MAAVATVMAMAEAAEMATARVIMVRAPVAAASSGEAVMQHTPAVDR